MNQMGARWEQGAAQCPKRHEVRAWLGLAGRGGQGRVVRADQKTDGSPRGHTPQSTAVITAPLFHSEGKSLRGQRPCHGRTIQTRQDGGWNLGPAQGGLPGPAEPKGACLVLLSPSVAAQPTPCPAHLVQVSGQHLSQDLLGAPAELRRLQHHAVPCRAGQGRGSAARGVAPPISIQSLHLQGGCLAHSALR